MLRLFFILIFVAFIIGTLVGVVILQIFLSKKENKWFGLILPMVSFCFSLIILSSVFLYIVSADQTRISTQNISSDGIVVDEVQENTTVESIERNDTSISYAAILICIAYFAILNIPTIVLLAIYAACRKKRKINIALQKMSIQDLE